MFFDRARPLLLRNAGVVGAAGIIASSLRIERGKVDGLDVAPRGRDVVLDLAGGFVFPGLLNAHDHLEHNHFGRVKYRERYGDAFEWAEDVGPRLATDPKLVAGRARPLGDRLFIGGLKNLLSGATTVAHHNPVYRELTRSFPVRVVRAFGWAHSLYLQGGKAGALGEPAGSVRERHRTTPAGWPFILHLAEGTNPRARGELDELIQLGCLGPRTVLVHAVGIDREGWHAAARQRASVVWCPASNQFLLGETIDGQRLTDPAGPNVALGTDSRLTGARDLLDELRVAAASAPLRPAQLARLVTSAAADVLGATLAGRIAAGLPADLLVVPRLAEDPYDALLATSRAQVALVLVDGKARYGAPELAEAFSASAVTPAPISVDGSPRLLDAALVRRLDACSIAEPGVGTRDHPCRA